jgi:hypothetical protein
MQNVDTKKKIKLQTCLLLIKPLLSSNDWIVYQSKKKVGFVLWPLLREFRSFRFNYSLHYVLLKALFNQVRN